MRKNGGRKYSRIKIGKATSYLGKMLLGCPHILIEKRYIIVQAVKKGLNYVRVNVNTSRAQRA